MEEEDNEAWQRGRKEKQFSSSSLNYELPHSTPPNVPT